MLLDILGLCSVLETAEHRGYAGRFVPYAERELPGKRFVERSYPACWWTGADGVNRAAAPLTRRDAEGAARGALLRWPKPPVSGRRASHLMASLSASLTSASAATFSRRARECKLTRPHFRNERRNRHPRRPQRQQDADEDQPGGRDVAARDRLAEQQRAEGEPEHRDQQRERRDVEAG